MRGLLRAAGLLCALPALWAGGMATAAPPAAPLAIEAPLLPPASEPSADAIEVSPADAALIVKTLRAQLAGKTVTLPSTLDRPAGGVMISFHTDAPPEVCLSLRNTLSAALGDAGDALARRLARRPDYERTVRDGRLQIDVLYMRQPVKFEDRMAIWKSLTPSQDGLLVTWGGRTVGFTPVMVMSHWQALDLVASLFVTQERENPPGAFTAERFRSRSFIEERPNGRVSSFTRGIVPIESVRPGDAVEAVARAGLWFLRTQQKSGAFFPRYSPSLDVPAQERYNYEEHLRAMMALNMLYEVTGDERFDTAFDRAMTCLEQAKLIRTEERYTWVPLEENDDITGTALLLSALSGRALTHKGSTMTSLMRQLGDSLVLMVSEDGRMYQRIVNARHRLPPYQLRGTPHAEALAALTLLQRVSPAEKAQAAAARLADILSVIPEFKTLKTKDGKTPLETEPGRFVLTRSDNRTMARVLEALADYDRQTRSEQHLSAIRDLTIQLMSAQALAWRGQTPESQGGVRQEKDALPDALTTGECLAGICAAYDFSMSNRRQEQALAGSAVLGATFLINMQHRKESMLYLTHPEALAGAFRRSPDDLSVQTAITSEAVRGLIRSVPVIAENVKPPAATPPSAR